MPNLPYLPNIPIWTVLMLLSGAFYAGGATWYAWDRAVIWRRLSIEEFALDFRRSIGRADPLQPILLFICLGSVVAFGLTATGEPRFLAFAAAAGLAANLLVSLLVLVPAQYAFARLPVGSLPPNAPALRERWLRTHRARTLVAVASFTLIAFAAALR
jgi:Na+-transporting methylmalonyl-CoA/oxaloacetate decarboxylase beta subunit